MNERHQTTEGTTRSQLAEVIEETRYDEFAGGMIVVGTSEEIADAVLETLGWDEAPTVLVEGRKVEGWRDWEHAIIFYHPTRQGGRYKLIRVDE